MALSKAQIDLDYLEVLARHATAAEQDAFSALSNSLSVEQIHLDIATLPEATSFVDPVIRLYQGAFNRVPDSTDPNGNFDTGAQSGFWVNVNALRAGIGLQALANAFVASAEFLGIYGTTAVTPALITAYYHNILQRDPASAEVAAWQATGLNAAQILIGFTQSAEFIAKSQASVNQFKLDLADGLHPSGPLLGPAEPPFTVEASAAAVDEGSPVTFTIQGEAADAGKEYAYTISGVSAADVVGGVLSGTVTLDSNGTAFLTVNLANDLNTEGSEQLTLSVNGIDASVTVNDTSKNPLVFTSTVGETLTGTGDDDTFTGVVDRTGGFDSSTFSNIVDIADGKGGFDTLKLVVNDDDGTDIVPNAPGVEKLLVTDLDGADYNLANMKGIQIIASDGSTDDMEFFNVQNIVDLSISNSDAPGGTDIDVKVIDAAGTGPVTVDLNNAGKFNLEYHNSSGDSIVTDWTFNSEGDNHVDQLDGAEITKTVTVNGSGTFHLDFVGGENTTKVTKVDASSFDGNFLMHQLDGNQLEVLGAIGNNDLEINDLVGGANVSITTQNGNDVLDIDSSGGNGQTVTIVTGDGNDSVDMDADASDGDTVSVTSGGGNNNHQIDVGANSKVTVTVGDGNNTIDIGGHNNDDGGVAGKSTVTVTAGNGANNINVNTEEDANKDAGSSIKITSGNGGNTVTANAHNAAAISILLGSGFDSVTATVDDGSSTVNVDVGSGGSTVFVEGDIGSSLTVTAADGADAITVDGNNGGNGASAITVNSGAGADSISIDYDAAGVTTKVNVNAGDDDDRVQLITDTNIKGSVSLDGGNGFDTLAVTSAGAAKNTIAGTVANFEALEVTNILVNDINLTNYVPGNNINKVILDIGWTGSREISGANTGFELDILDDANGDLEVTLNNAVNNNNDAVKIVLNETIANGGGGGDFGNIDLPNIESLTLVSTGEQAQPPGGFTNRLDLSENGGDLEVNTLTIAHSTTGGGDYRLDLNGGGALDIDTGNVQAAGFTGGLELLIDHAGAMVINAPDTTLASNVRAFNGSNPVTITLGNGDNTVFTGNGNDIITVGTGPNLIHAGLGVDQINLGAGGAGVSTLVFDDENESEYSSPDVVTGFNSATDIINLFNASTVNDNTGIHFNVVTSDAAVIGEIASLNSADTHINVVFNSTTGHLFIDADSNGSLGASDMEITLVGVTTLSTTNFSQVFSGI